MTKPIIICIDDEQTVLESIKVELKKAIGDDCIIETAEGGQEALDLFKELLEGDSDVALVVSDYIMPDLKGDEVLKRIHEMSPNTLTIMLTGQADLEAIGKAIKCARLYRYIAKPWQPEDLKLTIIEAVHSYLQDKKLAEQTLKLQQLNQELKRLTLEQSKIIAERTAELEKANEELSLLVNIDGLTNIANRRRFDEYFYQQWQIMTESKQPLSLLLADVDDFKTYNDQYGHPAGDDCLKQVAKVMSLTTKSREGLPARYGGEEFALVLPNTNTEKAVTIAENIRLELSKLTIPHRFSKVVPYVTISIGVSTVVPNKEISPQLLIAAADQGLLRAKKQGRDLVITQAVELFQSTSDS